MAGIKVARRAFNRRMQRLNNDSAGQKKGKIYSTCNFKFFPEGFVVLTPIHSWTHILCVPSGRSRRLVSVLRLLLWGLKVVKETSDPLRVTRDGTIELRQEINAVPPSPAGRGAKSGGTKK